MGLPLRLSPCAHHTHVHTTHMCIPHARPVHTTRTCTPHACPVHTTCTSVYTTRMYTCVACACVPLCCRLRAQGVSALAFLKNLETPLQARVTATWQQKLPQARDACQGPGSRCRAASNSSHVCPDLPLLFLATLCGPHSGPVLGLYVLHRDRTLSFPWACRPQTLQ